MCRECQRRPAFVPRPPPEPPARKSLVTKPEPLSVVHKHLDGRASTIAEHKHAPAERVLLQDFLANTSQAIDPTAEVSRLDGHQDPHLGRDLQHHSIPHKLRLSAARSGASMPFSWIRIFAKAQDMRAQTVDQEWKAYAAKVNLKLCQHSEFRIL